MSLRVLYKPSDELLAVRIKDLLEQEGIVAMLRSYQMPWYNGLAKMMRPEWGEVLIAEEDWSRAKELLDDLLASLEPGAVLEENPETLPGEDEPGDDVP
jgi:hypothetical protein